METELKETIQNLLLQFMQNMHEWEVMCNDIAKQSKLSFEEQFNKQKELVSKIFLTYCTSRERKYGRPTTISYGNEGSYEYDVNEEKITDIVEEGKIELLFTHIGKCLYDKRSNIYSCIQKANGF